jgi:hypothetical protein
MLVGFYFLLFIARKALLLTYSINLLSVGFGNLKVLNLGFNDISDACLVHLKGRCLLLSYL